MRLIDLDSDYIQETLYRRGFKTRQDIEEWLNNAPTIDAVPVVRCKDCKYADTERRNSIEKRYHNSILFCRNSQLCNDEPLAMWPDDFCNYGMIREDG